MTKRIRVENADCDDLPRVIVYTQAPTADGWVTVKSCELRATNLTEFQIHTHQRIVVQVMTGNDLLDGI